MYPEAPSTQYARSLVLKTHALSGLWDQSTWIFGTWTLLGLLNEALLHTQGLLVGLNLSSSASGAAGARSPCILDGHVPREPDMA